MSSLFRHSLVELVRDALLVALATAFALALAYQVRSRVVVDVGGKWDAPFVARFLDAEGDAAQTYRWTRAQSRVELEGQALTAPWTLRVRMNGYRPSGTAGVRVEMNGTAADAFQARDGWEIYEVEGATGADAWSGDNVIVLATDTFVPKQEIPGSSDTRRLGVATDWVELAPARSNALVGDENFWLDFGTPPVLPPPGVLLSWGAAFGLLYLAARGIGLPKRPVHIVTALLVLALAPVFAFLRPFVGYYTASFLVLAVVLALLAVFLVWSLPRFGARLGMEVDRTSLALLCGIVLLSAGLKWGGAWYPQFRSSDLLFHAHRLEFVARGELFFSSELPDAARRIVPYPPALYVALSPLTTLEQDYSALLIAFNVLADAAALVAIYFAARALSAARGGNAGDSRTFAPRFALLATFLFAFYPVAFWIYSWGNHTNIFGQAVATVLFAVLLGAKQKQRDRKVERSRDEDGEHSGETFRNQARPVVWGFGIKRFLLMLFLFVLASVSHLGIFLSLLAFFPAAILMRLLLRGAGWRNEILILSAPVAAGLAVAVALYYAEFSDSLLIQTQTFFADFGAGRAAGSGGITLARAGDVARYTAEQLGWVLLLVGFAGVPLAWNYFGRRARAVWGAWLVVGILFALVTLGSSFSTRYTLWAAPALALSGGLALAWALERTKVAQLAVYGLLGLAFAQTTWLWLDRVWNGYH